MIRQAQPLISPLNNLNANPQLQVQENHPVHIMVDPRVKYILIPFEGNINTGEPQWLTHPVLTYAVCIVYLMWNVPG